MRCRIAVLLLLSLSACSRHSQRDRDENSAAFKVGEAAHEVAKHAEKTAAAAGRQLEDSARKASEGWKQKKKRTARKPSKATELAGRIG